MMKILVTKSTGGAAVTLATYTTISNYSITDEYLILDDDTNNIKRYIQKDQVLEFEVYYE